MIYICFNLIRPCNVLEKTYQKDQGIKGQPAYSEISLFTMMLLVTCMISVM
ncbi:MAG: hypothetical protein ACMUEL_05945 [Flavobacteriales bacterium Tduv]